MDDTVDELYSAIKFLPDADLARGAVEREGRRWTDIVSFTINMEQIGDCIERVLQTSRTRRSASNRSFSRGRHGRDLPPARAAAANLRLGMSVFLDGHVRDARKLLEEKARFAIWSRVRRQPHRPPAGQHHAEHRDQQPAPGPDQRARRHSGWRREV